MQRNSWWKNFTKQILDKAIKEKIPILGICLELQLLAYLGAEGSITVFQKV